MYLVHLEHPFQQTPELDGSASPPSGPQVDQFSSGEWIIFRAARPQLDHVRGVIRNNIIVNLNKWADEGIETNAARDVRVEHNTVLIEGAIPWSIGVRFATTSALVRNNLTSRQIALRNEGQATLNGNVIGATAAWFVDPAKLDLRLTPTGSAAVDAGVPIDDVVEDFEGRQRWRGRAPDAGALESGNHN
jgi:hypothetical protein